MLSETAVENKLARLSNKGKLKDFDVIESFTEMYQGFGLLESFIPANVFADLHKRFADWGNFKLTYDEVIRQQRNDKFPPIMEVIQGVIND